MRRFIVVVAFAGALVFAPRAHAVPVVGWTCNNSPCTGWFTSNVQLVWDVKVGQVIGSTCVNTLFTTDTAGTVRDCIVEDADGQAHFKATIKRDTTAPVVTGATPARAADAAGWYQREIGVGFTGADLTSGVASCTAPTYAGPDAADVAVVGTCRDVAGNQSPPFAFHLRYDATPPGVTGVTPERPPDHGGWYTHPVTFGVQGADMTSGLAGCTPVTYGGPDGAGATLGATCVDRAGNTTTRPFPLRYDATAPDAGAAHLKTGDGIARLAWPADARATVVRTPGIKGAASSIMHDGPGGGLTDRRVRNGHRYRYALTLADEAGNVTRLELAGRVGPHPLSPARGARLSAPPLLRWTRVRGAHYYNVQLFRNGHKILSAWPRRPRLQLRDSWRFRGRRYHLLDGRYQWFVWPGEGLRSEHRYGVRIGARPFVISRA
jgi:hypothetical protein